MRRAPTAAQLLANPIVQEALQAAWNDSLADDPLRRHEEGGWIYCEVTTKAILIQRIARGYDSTILLASPPKIKKYVVVATFHTHPNPAADGWNTGPSDRDFQVAHMFGVPCLIRAEDGVHWTGPASRRKGLGGWLGFPEQEPANDGS